MITPLKMISNTIEADGDNKAYMELVGKKGVDTPPVEKFGGSAILNGSLYQEIDAANHSMAVYIYDESTHTWVPLE